MPESNYLDKLRHSAAHLLAASVLDIWPDAKPTIGPSVKDGFYYDFDFGEETVSKKDLPKIEEKMKDILKDWDSFEKSVVSEKKAREVFKDNPYKLELIDEIVEKGEKITLYKSGDFIDLCKGGHVENPKEELKNFKLLRVAGAYWRGSENNPMLTRIYGTAFETKEELDKHIKQLEEARQRDHKKLGKDLDLFTFSELVGSGLPLWTPKGTLLRNILDDFVWELRRKRGYEKVEIPHITKKDLYEKSGHWEKFQDELFKIETREGHEFVMKPMNCPHHTQIYDSKQRSYRDLPQRYCNTTMVYRDEQSGELSGLTRVRSITQDDAHVFCRKDQIEEEMEKIWDIVDEFYAASGFEPKVRLSLHDPENFDKYIGKQKDWKESEDALRRLAEKRGTDYTEAKGESAFYGPKIDFMAEDSLGREWQVATIQLDMNMPERFDLTCINEDGEKERIFMIHAAIMGAIERFMAVLIEHFAGAFPLWLSPVQVKVLPITERNQDYGQKVLENLEDNGIRVEIDDRNETLQSKIREAQLEKVPYILIVGDKEEKDNKVSVRLRTEKDLGPTSLDEFIKTTKEKVEEKSLEL